MKKKRKLGRRLVLASTTLAVVGLTGAAIVIDRLGVAPRTLAPYIEKRSSGHNPTIVGLGSFVSQALMALDRGVLPMPAELAQTLGAQPEPAGTERPGGMLVATAEELRVAISKAEAGDVITLLPGTYRFNGRAVDANRPGTERAPITVRAVRPGRVQVEFDQIEGFRVSAPWWRFENLAIHGVCGDDSYCEHAFHVVGAARHFASVNNTIADFNAHFKINGVGNDFPDEGLIEANTLANNHARRTGNPVVPIDLVAASRWTVRGNIIKDFVKLQGNQVSYGAFAKGSGSGNVFERNLVWCEDKLRGQPGQRIGLSLGGGGTGHEYCRDRKCITEQQSGIIRSNLIAACSDVGIYLNSAADSRINDNTLVDTTGIDVRFITSSARLDGNLVDGPIRSRNGGLAHEGDNLTAPLWQAYVGYHPVRSLFRNLLAGDFGWQGAAPRRAGGATGPGLCGGPVRAYGAFEDFGACRRQDTISRR